MKQWTVTDVIRSVPGAAEPPTFGLHEAGSRAVPHPIPYQGSKRKLAPTILTLLPPGPHRLFEPFAGSAAVSLAGLQSGGASDVVLGDANRQLIELWELIVKEPEDLASAYERLWSEQLGRPAEFYREVRADFNAKGDPRLFLYLLARCVKAAVRYNSRGEFNQTDDRRRLGAKPETMRARIYGAHTLLAGRTQLYSGSYLESMDGATADDIVYMDPPYQGVSGTRDTRYERGLSTQDFVDSLREMNERHLSYIISYDGHTGDKKFGDLLPSDLQLTHVYVAAGRSSSATLLGRNAQTVESLYISASLIDRLRAAPENPANSAAPTLFEV